MLTRSRARPRYGRCIATFAAALFVAAAAATADIPPDSAWRVTGKERLVARVLGRRIVGRERIESVLYVDEDRRWSIDVFEGSGHEVTVQGGIEERRKNRFVFRMDEESMNVSGEAVRQMFLDQGAKDAVTKRVHSRIRGKERDDGTFRVHAVARFRLRIRVRGRWVTVRLRASDHWTCDQMY